MPRGNQKQSAGRHGEKFWEEEKSNKGLKMMQAQGWDKGKGLGKDEGGRTEFLRAVKKNDSLGIGAKQGHDDNWCAMTGVFNDLLKRLNENNDYAHDDGGVKSEESEDETTGKKLKDFMIKRRLYGRFRKSKDTDNYSAKDMSEIFGKKKDKSETVSKHDIGYVAGTSKQKEDQSGVKTTTSTLSIADYFAQKMAAKAGGGGTSEASTAETENEGENKSEKKERKRKRKLEKKQKADEEARAAQEAADKNKVKGEKTKEKKKRKAVDEADDATPSEDAPTKKKKGKKQKREAAAAVAEAQEAEVRDKSKKKKKKKKKESE